MTWEPRQVSHNAFVIKSSGKCDQESRTSRNSLWWVLSTLRAFTTAIAAPLTNRARSVRVRQASSKSAQSEMEFATKSVIVVLLRSGICGEQLVEWQRDFDVAMLRADLRPSC